MHTSENLRLVIIQPSFSSEGLVGFQEETIRMFIWTKCRHRQVSIATQILDPTSTYSRGGTRAAAT